MLHGDAHRRWAKIRRHASQNFVKYCTQCINISASVKLFAHGLFWAHVGGCAQHQRITDGRSSAAFRHLDNTEVREKRLAMRIEQNIAGFKIAMDDATAVGFIQGRCHACHYAGCVAQTETLV